MRARPQFAFAHYMWILQALLLISHTLTQKAPSALLLTEIKFPPSSWISMNNTHKACVRFSQAKHPLCSSTAQEQMEVQSFLPASGEQPWVRYLKTSGQWGKAQ